MKGNRAIAIFRSQGSSDSINGIILLALYIMRDSSIMIWLILIILNLWRLSNILINLLVRFIAKKSTILLLWHLFNYNISRSTIRILG